LSEIAKVTNFEVCRNQ